MKLADKLKHQINFNEIINKLSHELNHNNDKVFIDGDLLEGNIQNLINEGFDVNMDGIQYNGGGYVGFKSKNIWQ